MTIDRRKFIKDIALISGALGMGGMGAATMGNSKEKDNNTKFEPGYLRLYRSGELQKREKELTAVLVKCRTCARKCEVNRLAGENDVCRTTRNPKVSSSGAHFGEERPLVGRYGSGTIFFSNCSLLCCYCQNWEIAHRGDGRYVSHRQLADMMLRLQDQGCHNINFVTPSHMVPQIIRGLCYAVDDGLKVPLVYNTGGYDNIDTIKLLDGIFDIYLPDFKYQDEKYANKYSNEAKDYPQVAAQVIKEMHRQVGVLKTDSRGVALRGLMIRHLVLPNNIAGTDKFVKWVAKELSCDTYVNIMPQYRPCYKAKEHPELNRGLTHKEWQQALSWAKEAGLTNLDRR
jgi:putative pyruvate formate lyase activating enzyme